MKKVLCLMLAVMLLFAVACSSGGTTSSGGAASGSTTSTSTSSTGGAEGGLESAEGAKVILTVSAAGVLDDRAFNQGCYNGVKEYAAENNETYFYYQPEEDTPEAQLGIVDIAVSKGAEFVIINSDQFRVGATLMTRKYPDVTFIMFDSYPGDPDDPDSAYLPIGDFPNLHTILFSEEQSSYLAAYATVMDGYRNLGFLGGMTVPAVVRFGYGWIQGAEDAAEALGLEAGEVKVKYGYFNNFQQTPENQTLAASWYNEGVEIIHAAAGPAGGSVMKAAEDADAKVVGVDSDQSGESDTVITSAMKMLAPVTKAAIEAWRDGTFDSELGGTDAIYGVKEDGVGLPMDTSKFETFTQEDYDKLIDAFKNDEISLKKDSDIDPEGDIGAQLGLELVELDVATE